MQLYKKLQNQLQFEHELPFTQDWSAEEDFLLLVKQYCIDFKPTTIVECSSGLSSIILAKCCEVNNSGHVYSLENAEQYQQQTKQNLALFSLQKFADVYHAPLEKITVKQQQYDWYNISEIKDVKIDLLVIDGPSGFIQKHSRLPALPVLFEQLADQSCIFLDDAARSDEKEMVEIWLTDYPELTHEYIETRRGCSIIKLNRARA